MYHIELVDLDGSRVLRRVSMRSGSIGAVRDRALRLLRRAEAPAARSRALGGVRILNGAGYEVYSARTSD